MKENSNQNHFIASGVFVVKNDRGLHTRPSTEIVKCATKYKSDITLTYKKTTVNARSILGVLMLAAEKGSRITVTAEGPDAEEAVKAFKGLAANCFHIKY
ncbi:MAG: HPr family phosphocarrier protein [Chlamydiota bacterium]|nr:HPr family phosphocarrier protein [Chlamydiota bacterium]